MLTEKNMAIKTILSITPAIFTGPTPLLCHLLLDSPRTDSTDYFP